MLNDSQCSRHPVLESFQASAPRSPFSRRSSPFSRQFFPDCALISRELSAFIYLVISSDRLAVSNETAFDPPSILQTHEFNFTITKLANDTSPVRD